MSGDHVLIDIKDHVAWITINHSERLNSFDLATQAALLEAFSSLGDDRTLGALVLTGSGDRAFCTGGFVGDLPTADLDDLRRLFFGTIAVVNAIRRARQPVIAAVNGYAIGGGNELVVACDFAIASERAILGQAGPRVGSAPVVGGTNMLALQIGEKKAKEVSFLCRQYSARDAEALGWVNEVVPHEALRGRVLEWCEELLSLSPRYLEIAKHSSNYWWDLLQPGFTHGEALLWMSAQSDEMFEGSRAFVEKRRPDFSRFRTRSVQR